jgi:aryl-alcohol dehydrogenase-like predicted oxidoreductase
MQTRPIGSLNVSIVGLGCNNFGIRLPGYEESARVIHAALDAGINFFDTADIYGNTKSEEYLGRALKDRRGEAIIATKFGNKVDDERKGAAPDYVKRAAEDSLRRLGVDVIDLYQLHLPDPNTPIADTLGALQDLVAQGKVLEIGCSNFSVEQLREAEAAAGSGPRFVSVQNHYNLFEAEAEKAVLEECARTNTAYLPFFPLARGLLTGKYRLGQPLPESARIQGMQSSNILNEANLVKVEKLIQFAESKGHTILELAFAWLLYTPVIASVIAGAMTPEQVNANAAASAWQLNAEEYAAINGMMQ